MASIYKDKTNDRWVAETSRTLNGKRHSKRFTSKYRHVVEKRLQEYLNPTAENPDLTILQLLVEVDTPEYMLKHLDALILKHPDSIGVLDIEELLATKTEFKTDTITRILGALTNAYRRGMATRRIEFDPTKAVRVPKGAPSIERHVITHQEETALLPHLSDKWSTYWMIGIESALRPQEIRALHVEDLEGGIIRVHRVLKNARAKRNLRQSQRLTEHLQASPWLDNGPLFPHNRSAPRQAIQRACKKEGIGLFAPYSLRHTALTRMADRGVSLLKLTQIAGHSSSRMLTQYYVHAPDVIDIE